MKLFGSLPLKSKLPLIIIGLCFAAIVVMKFKDIRGQISSGIADAEEELHKTVEEIRFSVTSLLEKDADVLRSLAVSSGVIEGLIALEADVRSIPDAANLLKRAYIDTNPNPVGKRHLLDVASGPESYHATHAALQPMLRHWLEVNDFYDIFLFGNDLTALHTVFKEADFMEDFAVGPLAATSLADVVKRAKAGEAGEIHLSDFTEYAPSNGAAAGFMATKVVDENGRTVGIMAVQLSIEAFAKRLSISRGLGETGQAYIVGSDMRARSASRFEGGFAILDQMAPAPQINLSADFVSGDFSNVELQSGKMGIAYSEVLEAYGAKWLLVGEMDSAEIMEPVWAQVREGVLATLVLMAIAGVVGLFVANSITKPIGRLQNAINSISSGNLNAKVADTQRGDELGAIAISLQGMVHKLGTAKEIEDKSAQNRVDLQHVVTALSLGLQDLSTGNLTRKISSAFAPEYEALRNDFNTAVDRLADTISQVIDTSQSIKARSNEISAASEDLSHRTENQAAALEETAAALDEMTASVKSAADSAREVEDIVRLARKEAEDSGKVVQSAVLAMAEIEKSSEQISQIIGAIDDIAFQTNLLALNAGVEAARAGDAGKGFAVVASEVRALAQRSSAAAKEIKLLIAASAEHVGHGVDQVGKAGDALSLIVGSVSNISTLVSSIASGAVEQSTGLEEINIGVTQLDQVTQQNAAMVEQSAAASQSLHQDAAGLSEIVGRFAVSGTKTSNSGVVTLSDFKPTDFAAAKPKKILTEADEVPQMRAAKAVGAEDLAMWQEF